MSYKTVGQIKRENTPILLETPEQKESVINNHKLVVVDLFGYWCGPCMNIALDYDRLTKQYELTGIVSLVKEDVDLGMTSVKGVPAFLFYVDGKEIESRRVIGGNMKLVEKNIVELYKELSLDLASGAHDAVSKYRAQNPAIFPNKNTQGS